MEIERRRTGHIRFPMRIPTLGEQVAPATSASPGLTKNLSRSGMLLQSRQDAKPGNFVRVTLHLRHRVPLTLTGTVMWIRPYQDLGWELGIRFGDELSQDLVKAIADEEFPRWGAVRTLAAVR